MSDNTKPTWLDKWRKITPLLNRLSSMPEPDENEEEIQKRVAQAVIDCREADIPIEIPFGQFRRGDLTMSDLNDPQVRPHFERLASFAEECGLSAEQLQKLITLTVKLVTARTSVQMQKRREANEPIRLMSGTGL